MNQLALDVKQEKARLSKQCAMILGRLAEGPATNWLLSTLSLKYTGRISELRQRGHDVRVIARDYKTGEVTYALFSDGKMVP